ncbi:MAG: metallophosphoesterase family protein [Candidatus Lindowbacteria bacterium]|nr:metallophosphoesterase family protein [Candidatus Lindowbacteria bacterium]
MVIGILADAHGNAVRLRRGIETLRSRGAETLIHLGDMADTLRLETVDECVETLIQCEIAGVMGNHEYSLVMHHFKRYPARFSEAAQNYVRSLPQRLELFDICFTHFSPFGGVNGLFAPTDGQRPLA